MQAAMLKDAILRNCTLLHLYFRISSSPTPAVLVLPVTEAVTLSRILVPAGSASESR